MKKDLIIIILLLVVSFPAVRSLFIQGGFTSHDLTHHVIRQISMDKLLSEGQFPPRWSGNLASGYGYPLFLFNYPLPAMLGEIFHKAGLGYVDSVKAVLLFSMLASVLGMYLFLKALLGSPRSLREASFAGEAGSRMAAFLGAFFYLYAPIHLITVYVSGSPGAAMGLVFPPFIFWAIVRLWQKSNAKYLIIGSLSLAGMVLSHNISAFIFTPLILGFVVVLKFLGIKKENKGFFKNLGLMFLLGLGLSTFFWLPAIVEKQYIRYDQLMKGIYIDQFPSLKQIIYSPWGYGLSHPKIPEGGMSYQIGLAHIFVVTLLSFLIWKVKEKMFFLLGIFSILPSVIAVFFMLDKSTFFWGNLPFLSYIQFPVRLLVVPVFCASIAAALLVKYLPQRPILFSLLLLFVFYANRNHLGINQEYNPGESYYLSLQTSATSFDENLPIWVSKIKTEKSESKFSFLKGGGNISILENKSNRVIAIIEATASAKIRFNQYYFPGWNIKVDEKNIPFTYLTDTEDSGLPMFDIEAGKHLVLARFKNTPVRNLADGITVITVIIFITFICKQLIKR